jgi:hypothetical protein
MEKIKALKALHMNSFSIPDSPSLWEMSWLEELSDIYCVDDEVERICSSFPHLKTLGIELSSAMLETKLSVVLRQLQLAKLTIKVHYSEAASSMSVPQVQVRHDVPSLEHLHITLFPYISFAPFLAYRYTNVTSLSLAVAYDIPSEEIRGIWEAVPCLESLELSGANHGYLVGISKCVSLRKAELACCLFSHEVEELVESGCLLEDLRFMVSSFSFVV